MTRTKTKKEPLHLSIIIDKLTDLGWDYSCNRMSRSGMEIFDDLIEEVTTASGWCIKSIDYEIQLK